MKEIRLLDTVVLNKDISGTGILAGTIGTVVDCLSKRAFLVEFISDDYEDISTHCLSADDLVLDMPYSDMENQADTVRFLPKLATEMAGAAA